MMTQMVTGVLKVGHSFRFSYLYSSYIWLTLPQQFTKKKTLPQQDMRNKKLKM
jgi:hypothetical protein